MGTSASRTHGLVRAKERLNNQRNRDKNEGGLIEFVREGFITKKIKEYETKVSETITSELPYQRKSGFVLVSAGHPLRPT